MSLLASDFSTPLPAFDCSTPLPAFDGSPGPLAQESPTPLLALDTSAGISVAVIGADTDVEINSTETRLHAEQLSVLIARALADAGLKVSDLAAVAVGTGPGPFTGLRVGLVAARTLAFALNLPIFGVCSLDALALQAVESLPQPFPRFRQAQPPTLDALALQAAESLPQPFPRFRQAQPPTLDALALQAAESLPEPGAEIVVATDARRREVYWARYQVQSDGKEHSEGRETPAGQVECIPTRTAGPFVGPAQQVDLASALVVGQGAVLYPDVLPPVAGAPTLPSARALGRIALARAAQGDPQPTEPLYLRRPDIQGQPQQLMVSPPALDLNQPHSPNQANRPNQAHRPGSSVVETEPGNRG